MKFKKLSTKNYLLQVIILSALGMIIYLMLYFFLPMSYDLHQEKVFEDEVRDLMKLEQAEIVEQLNDFRLKHQVNIVFLNEKGFESIPENILDLGEKEIIARNHDVAKDLMKKFNINLNEKTITAPFNYKNQKYTIVFKKIINSAEDVNKALIFFFPYFMGTVFILSLVSSYFHSRKITKPLLNITRKTENLARLKFGDTLNITTKDELEIIADNLNYIGNRFDKTLNKLEDEIEIEKRKEQNKRDFIAIMSHELKSPLTSLKGQTECMISKIAPFDNRDKYLKENILLINELEELVKEILLSSKLDDGVNLNLENLILKEMIWKELHKFHEIIQNKNLNIKVQLNDIEIYADKSLFQKVIKNIIENLVKYSDEFGYCEITMNESCIEFYNDSKNILESKESINSLLEPFKRLDESRNKEDGGHGLGLHIIKKVLDLHDFKLDFLKKDKGLYMKIDFKKEG